MARASSYRRITRPRLALPPLQMEWTGPGGVRPLPIRTIRCHSRKADPAAGFDLDAALAAYPACRGEPFDFSERMHRLCADIVSRCSALHHVRMERILIGVTQARSSRVHGLQARITPLRMPGGGVTRRKRGHVYQVQRCWMDGTELLYLMSFCLPRFQDQSFDEKFVTIFHELYHIAPSFDGDLRRHEGRCAIHTRSQKGYDRLMADLAREYLAGRPDPALFAFLRLNFAQLQRWHGSVRGYAIPVPKLVPLPTPLA